jgi:hypothetical protein
MADVKVEIEKLIAGWRARASSGARCDGAEHRDPVFGQCADELETLITTAAADTLPPGVCLPSVALVVAACARENGEALAAIVREALVRHGIAYGEPVTPRTHMQLARRADGTFVGEPRFVALRYRPGDVEEMSAGRCERCADGAHCACAHEIEQCATCVEKGALPSPAQAATRDKAPVHHGNAIPRCGVRSEHYYSTVHWLAVTCPDCIGRRAATEQFACCPDDVGPDGCYVRCARKAARIPG